MISKTSPGSTNNVKKVNKFDWYELSWLIMISLLNKEISIKLPILLQLFSLQICEVKYWRNSFSVKIDDIQFSFVWDINNSIKIFWFLNSLW